MKDKNRGVDHSNDMTGTKGAIDPYTGAYGTPGTPMTTGFGVSGSTIGVGYHIGRRIWEEATYPGGRAEQATPGAYDYDRGGRYATDSPDNIKAFADTLSPVDKSPELEPPGTRVDARTYMPEEEVEHIENKIKAEDKAIERRQVLEQAREHSLTEPITTDFSSPKISESDAAAAAAGMPGKNTPAPSDGTSGANVPTPSMDKTRATRAMKVNITSGVSIVALLQPGRTDAWKDFTRELYGARHEEYEASRPRLSVTHESAMLVPTAQGDMTITYIEAYEPQTLFSRMSSASDPFDIWFGGQIKQLYGLDIKNPPPTSTPSHLTNDSVFEWQAY
ncbi:MAG: hypothetical protein ABI670_18855 [Chloroflexota bacterium]